MVPTFHLTNGVYAEFYQAMLPDFVLALVFFTALCYAVLGRRFEHHQRAAVAISTVMGIALSIGLVRWEQQHDYTVRNLGPIAVGLAMLFLAVVVYQAFKLAGGTIAGAALALGATILIAWMLQVDWPVAQELVQTIAGAALIIGLIAFLGHHRPRKYWNPRHPNHSTFTLPRIVRPAPVRHDMGNLYDDRYVAKKLERGFRRVKERAGHLNDHPQDAQNVMLQLRRMLPAEGWLTERLTQLREQAFRIRNGHVARIEAVQHAFSKMNTEQRKQASRQLINEYQSLRLDQRMNRLDQAVAANEKHIRELTQKAQQQLVRHDYHGLTHTLSEARKLQTHNASLFKLIEQTEKQLRHLAGKITIPNDGVSDA